MLIRDWMTTDVVTATPDMSMMKASKILKEKKIRHLPVVDEAGKLVGMVSDRDIKEASPSKATTLDVHELYYLLSEIKVKDIMTKDPHALSPADTVERVASFFIDKRIGALPVVNDDGSMAGIISDTDLFKVLTDITGVRHGGVQMGFELANEAGVLQELIDAIGAAGGRIVSVMTSLETPNASKRIVNIRILPMDRADENKLVEAMQAKYDMQYWARDNVHTLS